MKGMVERYLVVTVCVCMFLSGCARAAPDGSIEAWATLAAAIIAVIAIINSNWQLKRQIENSDQQLREQISNSNQQLQEQFRAQNEFERKRIEAEYLGKALYIVRSGLKELQVFISAWTHYQARRMEHASEETQDEKAIRRELTVAWRKFEDDLEAALEVFKKAENESPLAQALQEALNSSIALYGFVTERTGDFKSEDDMMARDEAKQVVGATNRAAELLAERLSRLFRDV
jgi:hypothetical protein